MYSCPIANNLTYNFAGSPNGISALPALNNVPYLYAFCFENGSKRSLVLINTDLTSSHTISFSGTNPPQGTVTQRQYAPAKLDDMNEAHTGTSSNRTPSTVALETSTLSSPASITLPPYSATALDYTASGVATAAAPTFSPAVGTYTTSQTVTINDATAGTTIYYTTNGTTPTTSSSVYSAPITVSATETLEAIAVETGYTNSPVATAVYTISAGLPAPTFSPAAGTYTSPQSVTISDATAGAAIYYTTNGTTPTTSSSVYSAPITVNATETLEAIAVKTGYINSPVATAAYTIPLDFSISLSPNSLSLVAGQSATSTVTIIPVNGFNQTVSFGCTGLPAGLSCAFSPSSIAISGTSSTTILTITANSSLAVRRGISPLIPVTTAAFLLCTFGFRKRRKFYFKLFIAGLILGLAASNGCNGYPGTTHSAMVTSTVMATATAGTIQQAAALTVTVN
jgi:LysM repeat protein